MSPVGGYTWAFCLSCLFESSGFCLRIKVSALYSYLSFSNIYLCIWLGRVLVAAWGSSLHPVGSFLVVYGLGCPAAGGILVYPPGVKPISCIAGRFFTSGVIWREVFEPSPKDCLGMNRQVESGWMGFQTVETHTHERLRHDRNDHIIQYDQRVRWIRVWREMWLWKWTKSIS